MSARNRRLSAARGWAHDLVCQSGCRGDGDHARRTQHGFAREVADIYDPAAIAEAIHRRLCLGENHPAGCTNDTAHINWLIDKGYVTSLTQALAAAERKP